jgi:hypothetical protein
VSLDIHERLPLYCRNIALAQARIASLFRTHVVVHNRVYGPLDVMGSGPVDLVVLVVVDYPQRLVDRIPCKVFVIALNDGDISLYDVVRPRSMHALAEVLQKGRWVRMSVAESKYADPMPFATACEVALRLGHISIKENSLMLR